jgi:hypothetical protein
VGQGFFLEIFRDLCSFLRKKLSNQAGASPSCLANDFVTAETRLEHAKVAHRLPRTRQIGQLGQACNEKHRAQQQLGEKEDQAHTRQWFILPLSFSPDKRGGALTLLLVHP